MRTYQSTQKRNLQLCVTFLNLVAVVKALVQTCPLHILAKQKCCVTFKIMSLAFVLILHLINSEKQIKLYYKFHHLFCFQNKSSGLLSNLVYQSIICCSVAPRIAALQNCPGQMAWNQGMATVHPLDFLYSRTHWALDLQ